MTDTGSPQPSPSTPLNREHAMKIQMVNPTTKDIRSLTTEFDWGAFLSVFVFGIPHFLRGLHVHGGIIIALNLFSLTPLLMPLDEQGMMVSLLAYLGLFVGVAVAFGVKGSEQYAKALLARGYLFQNPEGELAQAARSKWSIAA
ncbi:hypothetical protein [Azospirillum aestuarii]|uniref:hypothetical protein n=1 Tax=Azospirillum aestuarii TaxID=2802052 RepID=UPI004054E90F